MLPTHVRFYSRIPAARSQHERPWRDVLLTRARITNLGFILLLALSTLSCMLNLYHWLFTEGCFRPHTSLPHSVWSTIARDKTLGSLEHLVIVPGHAIWKGSRQEDTFAEDEWLMESFQQGDKSARITAYHEHISRGIDLVTKDESALLVFSGGNTKSESPHSEASSYHHLALVTNLISSSFARVTTEEDALDSYQNLLFSIARFHEYTGRYPTQITVVGYEMKRKRFEELHRAAIRWPSEHFQYIGIDAEAQDIEGAREGERRNGYIPYSKDAYGCHDVLLSKRRSRNPHIRYHPYFTSSPELGALFNWCPPPLNGMSNALFRGPLPWDSLNPKTKAIFGIALGKDSS